tara:strand:+ start:226 stop:579 length:354 start_codon:yes stop_codon:yes gene_type:complete
MYRYDIDKYQETCSETAVYPEARCIEYLTLGLTSEAGEVAGKIKKLIRDRDKGLEVNAALSFIDKEDIISEMGDVLWYIAMLAWELDYNLSDVAYYNVEKLQDRKQRGTLKGSGDKR